MGLAEGWEEDSGTSAPRRQSSRGEKMNKDPYLDALEEFYICREAPPPQKRNKTTNTRSAMIRFLTSSPNTELPRITPLPVSTS
jgi:hypothetical protein